jgi:adenylate cyclase
MAVTRRLTAILAADVAGYSRLMGADEEGTHQRLKAHFGDLVDPKIKEHRGRTVKNTGDGLLAEFPSVVDAVRCAAEVQRGMIDREPEVPDERRIRFRIGINLGDVIVEEHDIFGDGVNVAARLETLAEPGGICVSRVVRDQVRDKLDFAFEDMGEQSVKNIARPVRVYEMCPKVVANLPVSGTPASTPISPPARAPRLPSILVLPFRNISGDRGQDYVTDAVTSDLTVDLSRMRDIAVISAGTALSYKGSGLDIRQIGRELGVRYLVVGNIGRSGDLVHTNVQLLDASSGEQLWGDRFENRFVELERLEDAITGRIAASLNVQLVRAEGRRATRVPQPDALDLRLRATALFFSSIAPEHTLATRQLLQRSAELDPNSAETWARLGQNVATDYVNSWNNSGQEELRVAEEAVRRALLIDPGHALAHMVHGLVQRARGEHHAALEAFSRAIELDRNFAAAYANKGNQSILVGRPAEAQALVEQAIRLSPHDPSIGMFYWIIGRSLFFTGRYRQAVAWLRKSIETRPNLWFNRLYLVSACTLADMNEEARRALSEFNRRFPDPLYTLAVVEEREAATPNDDPTVVAARDKFHEGLRRAGMAAR